MLTFTKLELVVLTVIATVSATLGIQAEGYFSAAFFALASCIGCAIVVADLDIHTDNPLKD